MIYLVVGLLLGDILLIIWLLFVVLYYSFSVVVFVGGGLGMVCLGVVSRVYCGVLFLDECVEISFSVLEVL